MSRVSVRSTFLSACRTICQPPGSGNGNTKVTKNSSRSSHGQGQWKCNVGYSRSVQRCCTLQQEKSSLELTGS